MSRLIPNSYQVPNLYSDALMPLLTGNEWKVLCYLMRRTFGFGRRSARVSLDQLANGTLGQNGERLDGGTGLARATLIRALGFLRDARIVVEIAPAVRERSLPPEFELQLDDTAIDWGRLEIREREAGMAAALQTQAATMARNPQPLGGCPAHESPPYDEGDPSTLNVLPPGTLNVLPPGTLNVTVYKERNPVHETQTLPALIAPVEPSPEPPLETGEEPTTGWGMTPLWEQAPAPRRAPRAARPKSPTTQLRDQFQMTVGELGKIPTFGTQAGAELAKLVQNDVTPDELDQALRAMFGTGWRAPVIHLDKALPAVMARRNAASVARASSLYTPAAPVNMAAVDDFSWADDNSAPEGTA